MRRLLPAIQASTPIVLVALLIWACTAIGKPTPPEESSAPPPLPNSTLLRSNARSYELRWRAEPPEVPLNEPFALRLQVRGDPTQVTDLHVDAIMPDHRHGMLRRPRIRRLGEDEEGTFLVEGMLFHMTGLWELHFDLTRGAITERAQVDIVLE
jgi:hypothetical protein